MLKNTNPDARWASLQRDRFAHLNGKEVFLVWIAFFLFYAVTAGRDLLPADGGEFLLVITKWGIAHPPGYPLYTIIGALWSYLLSWVTFPYRTNLLSAVLAPTTLSFIYKAVVLWAMKGGLSKHSAKIGAFLASFLMGTAGTFWAQATIANIRMPTLLFTAWGFSLLAQYDQKSPIITQHKVLWQLALVIGLGVGHHPSLMFVVVGWAVYIMLCNVKLLWTPHRWLKALAVAMGAWAIPQLYLPIRGAMPDVLLNPGNLATWQGFWNHVLARGFSGDMFAFATKTDLSLRFPLLLSLFRFQFPSLSLFIMVIGWFWLVKWQPKLAIASFISWATHTFVTITYRAPQTIEYLMPAYIPMVLVFGLCVSAVWEYGSSHPGFRYRWSSTGIVCCIVLLLLRLVSTTPDFATLAASHDIRDRVEPILSAASENTRILADWRWVTPLWGMQKIENRAPLVNISYVYPEEPKSYQQVWLDRVEAAAAQTLFVTHKYDWPGWNFVPVGGGYRLYRRPLLDLPANINYTDYQAEMGNIRLLGYKMNGILQPGQTIELHLTWQAIQPLNPPPSFTARLWDYEGNLLAASDSFLGSDSVLGEIRFTQLVLQLPLDRCSPQIQVTLGVYTVLDGAFIDLGTVTLSSLSMMCQFPDLPVVRHWPGYFAYLGPVVRGIDYDMRDASGGVAYLHLAGPGDSIIIQSDAVHVTVPALELGDNFTALIHFNSRENKFIYSRSDGSTASLLGLSFPPPLAGERYTPFGDKMVLIANNLREQDEQTVLNLEWVTAQPLAADYVVSARLRPEDDSYLVRHDMQPGLGAIPTLKWVTKNSRFLDPHPFTDLPTKPGYFDVTVYDPFRMTPLPTPYGEIGSYALP